MQNKYAIFLTATADVYQYIFSIEFNISDFAVINKLMTILSKITYPVIISDQIEINDIYIYTGRNNIIHRINTSTFGHTRRSRGLNCKNWDSNCTFYYILLTPVDVSLISVSRLWHKCILDKV